GLAPAFTNTTGVRETEADSQPQGAISTWNQETPPTTDPAQLLPEILDRRANSGL
ncbi:unnamed protein product, partial [marine sediment metagenome]